MIYLKTFINKSVIFLTKNLTLNQYIFKNEPCFAWQSMFNFKFNFAFDF